MGFSRQEHWSGLPFPSPMQESEKGKWSHVSHVPVLATPWSAAHQAPPSMGFSRQEHWSGLPFSSPMDESEKWKWSHSVMASRNTKWWSQCGKPFGFLKKLNVELPYEKKKELPCGPPILGEVKWRRSVMSDSFWLKTKTETDICTPVLTTGLFTITKVRDNPNVHQRMNR